MNVLSLFDGMSCGQQALERAGFKVENYFASEIDKYAIQVTMANYPNTKQLGSVVNVNAADLPKIDLLIGGSPCQSFSFAGKRKGMSTKCEIEILTLEHYLKLKAEGYQFEGQSYLFWEFMRVLNDTKPKYFLLENVEMGEKWEKVLSKAIGVNGIHINSALLSAQNRKRIYWTNIGMDKTGLFGDLQSIIEQPKDKGILLKDIIETNVDEKYYLSDKAINSIIKNSNNLQKSNINPKKSNPIQCPGNACGVYKGASYIIHNTMPRSSTTGKGGTGPLSRSDGKTYCLDTGNTNAVEIVAGTFRYDKGHEWRDDEKTGTLTTLGSRTYSGSIHIKEKIQNSNIRRLTPLECERLQTVKDNYTNFVSDSQRYRMLGNGWTVDVIAHIFKYII